MVNSNHGGEGKALLQVLSHNPNVQIECSESGTVIIKYGQEVILETNLQIPQLSKPVLPENSSIITTPETPESNTSTQTTPESNPQSKPAINQSENKLSQEPIESPNNQAYAKISIRKWEKRLKETQKYSRDETKHSSEPDKLASVLLKLLIEYCHGEEEVRQCCFHLILKEPKYDEIIGEKGKDVIARCLVKLLFDRKQLDKLVKYLKEKFPDIIIQ
ncbi:hypothetical protein [Nostoc sp. FACHB-280]|uniref:hypothetical protein n=1 Tax=Nostoc sp. FACHB-280 TaxID=2692839 RepID=UPI00168A7CF7|nr:hypothetical protein [Nostoc sp. FACHB-280]MBD2497753.1 hypothetical protein [Nostoc sp. FACHB-280]